MYLSRVNRYPHKTQSSFTSVSYPTKAVSLSSQSQVKMGAGSVGRWVPDLQLYRLISLTQSTLPLRWLRPLWENNTSWDNFQWRVSLKPDSSPLITAKPPHYHQRKMADHVCVCLLRMCVILTCCIERGNINSSPSLILILRAWYIKVESLPRLEMWVLSKKGPSRRPCSWL